MHLQEDDTELVCYFVVNSDLNMSPGKIAAQVAHAAVDVAVLSLMHRSDKEEFDKFRQWYLKGQKKIILRAHQKKLEELSHEFLPVVDYGLTEVPEGSLTCVTLCVMSRLEAAEHIKRLQLL